MKKEAEDIANFITPSIEAMGYILWGIDYNTCSKNSVLRVFIDHENGIGIEDCEKVSHQLSGLLDVNEELIPGNYFLEISSPGLERPFYKLEQFADYIGSEIKFQLHRAIDEKYKRFNAKLIGIENEMLVVELILKKASARKNKKKTPDEDIILRIPFDCIQKCNLVI